MTVQTQRAPSLPRIRRTGVDPLRPGDRWPNGESRSRTVRLAVRFRGVRVRSSDMRAIAVTAAGLLFLAVVGLASGGSPWHARNGRADVPSGAVRAAAAVAGVLVVGSLLLVWVGTPGAAKQRRRPRRLTARDFEELGASLSVAGKAAALVAAAVGLFVLISLPFITQTATRPQGGASKPAARRGGTAAPPAAGHTESNATLAWLVAGAGATLLLLTPAAVVVRRRRARRGREAVVPDVAARVGSGLRGSIAELEGEQDPRVAIQRAYAYMEESFGAIEIVRARDETPSEFTTRLLRVLGASAAAASDLTGLFELARFSDHTLGEGDRRRAIACVRRVEAEIARR
jgi:Domain of unknown function (DUF4129)